MFMLEKAVSGSRRYWAWILFLTVMIGIGLFAYVRQLQYGLGVTGLGRDFTWGLYIAQFAFLAGVAVSAAIVAFPCYVRQDDSFGATALLGQSLAVAAVVMALLFVFVDMGQPARVFNVLLHAAPGSIMFWDMVALVVYLGLNAAITVGVLHARSRHAGPPGWARALAILSIPCAIAMRTVSALLYSGLPGRSFWLSAAMAPRALAAACASGAALLILICLILSRVARFDAGRRPLETLARVAGVAIVSNLFLMLMEMFTVFYSGIPEPREHFAYIMGGGTRVTIWMWLSVALSAGAAWLLLSGRGRRDDRVLACSCAAACLSLWIEKSILLAGGFVPSPMGAVAAYVPSITETAVTLGIWAGGLLMITVFYKITLAARPE